MKEILFLPWFAVVKTPGAGASLGWYNRVVLGSRSPPGAVPRGWVQSTHGLWSWHMNMKHANASIN